jgi:3-hydroxyisobutyrate dehydrogenase
MGSRMAGNLIKAGHQLTVWNRDASKATPLAALGAAIAGTPKAAATGAEIVIAMVRDDGASRRVWLDAETGALAAMGRQAIAIDCSTLTVAG